jgi:hypothetical protein
MLAKSAATAALALRTLIFAAVFMGPVGAFALSLPGNTAGVQGAGLVLFVSLQRMQ